MKAYLPFLAGALLASLGTSVHAQIHFMSKDYDAPKASTYVPEYQDSPDGHTLGLNTRFLTKDGKPWLPVMGEFHYTRVPRAEWEEEILKVKASGVDIIATYVIWNHQEEIEGNFDWSGQRNLREFVELCRKHGISVFLRIGPWAHGEARNGGYPDWLLQKAAKNRENDPSYLAFVATYFNEIGKQIHGELWKDGGPIVGVQLENEYAKRGPGAGEEHILELKKLAKAAGLLVPFYSVTGWDGAVIPRGQVIAVFGGYPDAPWDAALTDLPPQEVYAFRFGSRVTGNMGMMGLHPVAGANDSFEFPFMTAEMGGGIQDTYHRRPIVQPDDVASMVPVMLGSGVNLYGSYMYQGGENPDGKLTTLQESQRTGYPTDVPVMSYDFQAPLGEFGQERAVLRKLKVFNFFMNSFGGDLAPMQTYPPKEQPSSPSDLGVPRVSFRSQGKTGFLFFNNYIRNSKSPVHRNLQVQIELPGVSLTIPEKPIDLPTDAYGIWPVNMKIGAATLVYATAQPFTHLEADGTQRLYFIQTEGVTPEFVWDYAGHDFHAASGSLKREGAIIKAYGVATSFTRPLFTFGNGSEKVEVYLVSQGDAEHTWRVPSPAGEHLLLTADEFWNDGSLVHLDRRDDPHFRFIVTPTTRIQALDPKTLKATTDTHTTTATAELSAIAPSVTLTKLLNASEVPPIRMGPAVSWRAGVAMAPDDTEFARAAKWTMSFKDLDLANVKDVFLDVSYVGDVARISKNDHLLDDDFYNGKPWELGMRRFGKLAQDGGLILSIVPLRLDAPIFLEKQFRRPRATDQVISLERVRLSPQYEMSFTVQ